MVKQVVPGSSGVQPLQSEGPGPSLQKGQQYQQAARNISSLADNAMVSFQRAEQDQASADMSIEYSQWFNQATSKDMMSTSEALEMGVDDNPKLWTVDDEGAQKERDNIALWEVLPDVAKRKYESMARRMAENISGSGNKQSWLNERLVSGQRMYSNMLASQREAAFKARQEKHDMSISAALQSGDNTLAKELALSYPGTDEERMARQIEVSKKVETNSYNRALQQANLTGDVSTLLDLADWIDQPENYSSLDESQQVAWSNTLRNTAKSIVGTKTKKILEDVDQMNVVYRSQIELEDWGGAMETLANMQMYMLEQGEPHYLGKQWYAEQVAKMTEAQVEQQEYLANVSAFVGAANGGYAYADATDSEVRKDIDKYAVETIGNAFQTGGQQAGFDAIRDVVRSSASFQYLPKYLEAQINMLNSPSVTNEHMQTITQIYANIQATNPMLLADMDDKTKLMAASLFKMSMAGGDPQENFKQLQATFKTKNETEVEKLRREWSSYRDSKQRPTEGMMESFIRQSKGLPYVPDVIEQLWTDLDTQGVSTTMMDAFENLSEEYFVMTGDKDVAMRAAFADVVNSWQVSNTNGRKRYMRDSPEYRYGATSEDVDSDFRSWTSEQPWYEAGSDYVLVSDVATAQEKKPGYSIYKMVDDMPIPATDENGKFARYYPRIDLMKRKKKEQEINRALWERQWEQATSTYQGATANMPGRADYYKHASRKERYEARKAEKAAAKAAENRTAEEARMSLIEQRSKEIAQDRQVMEEMGIFDRIKQDEGFRDTSYMDTRGNLTGGTGHKLTGEEKKKYPEGTKIPKEVTDKWFKEDSSAALEGAQKLLKEHGIENAPPEFQETVTNMVFQMGVNGVRKFKNMWAAAKEGNYVGVKKEMLDSAWAEQTPNRVAALISRLNIG